MAMRTRSVGSSVVSRNMHKNVPSFGFSGAGFLTAYHLGAADCLLKHGILLGIDKVPHHQSSSPILTGVSGGALATAAISMGIHPEDGMKAILAVADRTRRLGGALDHLRPGFSLVDQVEELILELTQDLDQDFALRRMDGGRLLRIGLTDSGSLPWALGNLNSYLYVDDYQSIEEVISACILSSYVPGVTGPVLPQSLATNGAVGRAKRRLDKMMERGALKDVSGQTVVSLCQDAEFWDGGLSNVFPIVDASTCLVTPFKGNFATSHISPSAYQQTTSSTHSTEPVALPANASHRLYHLLMNVPTIRYVAFSSQDHQLEYWYQLGYDNSLNFLDRTSQRSIHTVSTTTMESVATTLSSPPTSAAKCAV